MADKGVIIEYDFAAIDGAGLLSRITEGFLADLGEIPFDSAVEARHFAGGSYQGCFAEYFQVVRTKKTALKAARDFSDLVRKEFTAAVMNPLNATFVNFVKALIRHTQEKYNIDAGRIYMQGMSMGHMMTDQFARYYGDLLAGAAGSGASPVASQLYDAEGKRINYGGPVDIWISHPEWNGMGADDDAEHRDQRNGREYWGAVNECDMVPQIRIEGEYNYAFYTGKKGNMVWVDIKNRDHGQALDEAFLYWKYLFSGVRRDGEGNLVHTRTMEDRTGDKFGIAVADGVKKAWFRNQAVELTTAPVLWQKLKYHGLNGGQMVRGEYLCVPVSFLAEVFGAEYTPSPDTLEATLKLQDGRTVQFARGIIGALVDQELTAMYCEALHRNGELLVSVEWFCKYLFGLEVTSNHGMVYITDHFAELSQFMAELIRDLLK